MLKSVGIMQPYFLPYIGYWQLINHVDEFILYDNIKYTKKGWINRNRYLSNHSDAMFSLPLKAASDFLPVTHREIAGDFDVDKLLRQFTEAYRKAPFFKDHFPIIEAIMKFPERNLFTFIHNSIRQICVFLDIQTPVTVASCLKVNHASLRAEEKVVALCHAVNATDYINPIGGVELYDKKYFEESKLNLRFLKARNIPYTQLGAEYVPYLSILDIMMFNDVKTIQSYLKEFDLS